MFKKSWVYVSLSTISAFSVNSVQEKSAQARKETVKEKLARINRTDLLAMMRSSDCRCLSKSRSPSDGASRSSTKNSI